MKIEPEVHLDGIEPEESGQLSRLLGISRLRQLGPCGRLAGFSRCRGPETDPVQTAEKPVLPTVTVFLIQPVLANPLALRLPADNTKEPWAEAQRFT